MAAPKPQIYSERFVVAAGSGYWPFSPWVGYRFVVKSVSVYNGNSHPVDAAINLNGFGVWRARVPADSGAGEGGLMIVAYAGDTLQLVFFESQVSGQVSGFAFKDTDASRQIAVESDPPALAVEPAGLAIAPPLE